ASVAASTSPIARSTYARVTRPPSPSSTTPAPRTRSSRSRSSQDGDAGVEAGVGVEGVFDPLVQVGNDRVDRAGGCREFVVDDADAELGDEAAGAGQSRQVGRRQRPATTGGEFGRIVG